MQIFIDILARKLSSAHCVFDGAEKTELVENDSAQKAAAKLIKQMPASLQIAMLGAKVELALASGNGGALLAALGDLQLGVLHIAAQHNLPLEPLLGESMAGRQYTVETAGKMLEAYRAGRLRRSTTPYDAVISAIKRSQQTPPAPAVATVPAPAKG